MQAKLNIRIESRLAQEVHALALKEGKTASDVIREAILQHLAKRVR